MVGTNEEYAADADGGINAGLLNTASLALLAQTGQLDMGNSRVFAIEPEGEPGGPTVSGPSPYLPGWPKKVGLIFTELLPVVGRGHHRLAGDRAGRLPVRRAGHRRSA